MDWARMAISLGIVPALVACSVSATEPAAMEEIAAIYTQAYETAHISAIYTQAYGTAFASLATLPPTAALATATVEFVPVPALPEGAACIPQDNPRESAFVTGVVDGDTIQVQMNGQSFAVRYIGIDTPETGQANYLPATQENEALVSAKAVTMVKDVSETDRYGRLLRYVIVGDTFVNYELVALGLATSFRYPPDTSCADQLDGAQSQAQAQNIGLWQIVPTQSITRSGSIGGHCSPAYPTVCIEPPPPDLDCKDVPFRRFQVLPPDPHNFDGDSDGVGCEG